MFRPAVDAGFDRSAEAEWFLSVGNCVRRNTHICQHVRGCNCRADAVGQANANVSDLRKIEVTVRDVVPIARLVDVAVDSDQSPNAAAMPAPTTPSTDVKMCFIWFLLYYLIVSSAIIGQWSMYCLVCAATASFLSSTMTLSIEMLLDVMIWSSGSHVPLPFS